MTAYERVQACAAAIRGRDPPLSPRTALVLGLRPGRLWGEDPPGGRGGV